MNVKRENLIQRTITALSKLPENKVNKVVDFAENILKKYDEEIIQQGIQNLTGNSKSFDFSKNEEDLYSLNGFKEVDS